MCIVGAGLMGCATALFLARRGVDVIVLERASVGAGSSTRGMGGVRQQFADEADVRLVQKSVRFWQRFKEETGEPHDFAQRGYLFVAQTEAGLAGLRAEVKTLRGWGVDVRMVDGAEIAELVPGIRVDDLVGGRFCPQDGYGDPAAAVHGFAEAARRAGAHILEERDVRRLIIRDGRVVEVEASGLRVATERVLVACGAWSAEVLASCGVSVPIWPYRRQLGRTGPFPALAQVPMTIEWESGLHFRPKGDGLLFAMPNLAPDGALEKAPRAPAPAAPLIADPRALRWAAERAARRHPAFADLHFAEAWACYYEMTPDDHPILGALPEVEGLFIAAGFSGHGFMQSPAVGMCMAELLAEGRATTIDLSPFGVERFRGGRSSFRRSVL